jgi:uncharacterized membrane protein
MRRRVVAPGTARRSTGTAGSSVNAIRTVPTGALYSILLMFHVLCAVVGFGAVGVTGIQAARARRGPSAPGADAVQRYFRPGVNWAGRALYGVPVFGFALLAASSGAFDVADAFVVAGLVLWSAAVAAAEAILWPGERRIQVALSQGWGGQTLDLSLDRECRVVSATAVALTAVFVAATVLMVGKP